MAEGAEGVPKEPQGQCIEANRQCAVLRKAALRQSQGQQSTLNWQEKLRSVVASGELRSVLSDAFSLLQEKIPPTALGSQCTVKQLGVLTEAANLGQDVPA